MTGDGKPELLIIRVVPTARSSVLTWCAGAHAYLVSLDGTVVRKLETSVDTRTLSLVASAAGDVDGDGRPDVFVSIDSTRGHMPFEIRSIAGDTIVEFKGASTGPPPAVCVRGPDLDGDDVPEILLGMPTEGVRKRHKAGEIHAISGKNGRRLRVLKGRGEYEELGRSIVALPDIDGDGVADFAAGAPGWRPKKKKDDDTSGWGAVIAFSGKTGKPIWTARCANDECDLGRSLDAMEDIDGDGVIDLVAGGPGFGSPRDKGIARVISGKTGKTLMTHIGN